MNYILKITILFAAMALAESRWFWSSYGNKDAFTCTLPADSGMCQALIIRYFYNATSEKCEQFGYGGCGGNKNNFITKKDCEARCNNTVRCPADKPLTFCNVIPCKSTTCPAYPHARCVHDYCGGCKADYYVGNKKVNCKVAPCLPHQTKHNCLVAPCDVKKCQGKPEATCVNNYCDGCFADFYDDLNQKVDCKKATPCSNVKCKKGTKCIALFGQGHCFPSFSGKK